jgi:hypothetical protein
MSGKEKCCDSHEGNSGFIYTSAWVSGGRRFKASLLAGGSWDLLRLRLDKAV